MATEQHGTFRCREGELFLLLPLTENLTEDTGAGKLILTSVRSALLTRKDYTDKHRVYEAKIEGKGKDYVYLTLLPVCVRELKLQPGMEVEVSFLKEECVYVLFVIVVCWLSFATWLRTLRFANVRQNGSVTRKYCLMNKCSVTHYTDKCTSTLGIMYVCVHCVFVEWGVILNSIV